MPPLALDLMIQMLDMSPSHRPSVAECLNHPWLRTTDSPQILNPLKKNIVSENPKIAPSMDLSRKPLIDKEERKKGEVNLPREGLSD